MIYGFVDASESGFGSKVLIKGMINYLIVTWSSTKEKNSSNCREFENLVFKVEMAGKRGWLDGSTFILATENVVVESAL